MATPRESAEWQLDPADFPAGPIEEQLAFICRYGILAPSVHNTQPWQFSISGHTIHVRPEPSRLLEAGDATGRQIWISLGACAENLIAAASSFGLKAGVNYAALERSDHPDQIEISFRKSTSWIDDGLQTAILNRRTNRSIYLSKKVPARSLQLIQDGYKSKLVTTIVTNRPDIIATVADLTGRGIAAAFSSPAFRAELASLINHEPTRPLGIPTYSLELGSVRGRLEAGLVRYGLNRRKQAQLETKRMGSAAALVLTFSRGDTAAHWFEAGRAYEHAALVATGQGLATATNAAVVEAFDFHQDIEQLVKSPGRLQTVMRLGYSPTTLDPVPRLDLASVLAK